MDTATGTTERAITALKSDFCHFTKCLQKTIFAPIKGNYMKNSSKFVAGLLVLSLAGFAFAQEEGEVLGEYGAITVKMLDGKRTALISSESKETVEINEDVEIDSLYYDRDFSSEWGKPGTLMLPVTMKAGWCFASSMQIYVMKDIRIGGNESWQIDVYEGGSNSEFFANTPYFVRPSANRLSYNSECLSANHPVVMNTSKGSSNKMQALDNWEFRGMYSYKKWEEGDPDLGYLYGFAAREKEVNGKIIHEGQFVKGKAGAYIRPFRAYLIYNQNSVAEKNNARRLAKSADETAVLSVDELPSTIDVVFHDDDGTTSIYKLNTHTGEFSAASGWYDMKGRKLNQKPTISGNYFYNGKKVTIK